MWRACAAGSRAVKRPAVNFSVQDRHSCCEPSPARRTYPVDREGAFEKCFSPSSPVHGGEIIFSINFFTVQTRESPRAGSRASLGLSHGCFPLFAFVGT